MVTHALSDFAGYYIYPHKHSDSEYVKICSEHIDATVRSFFIKMAIMILSLNLALIGPMYVLLFYGIETTICEAKFPFIDANSKADYLANFIFECFIAGHGGVSTIALEVAMSIWSNVATISPKLIEFELKKLNNFIQQKPTTNQQENSINKKANDQTQPSKSFTDQQTQMTLKNILKLALDSDKLVSKIYLNG